MKGKEQTVGFQRRFAKNRLDRSLSSLPSVIRACSFTTGGRRPAYQRTSGETVALNRRNRGGRFPRAAASGTVWEFQIRPSGFTPAVGFYETAAVNSPRFSLPTRRENHRNILPFRLRAIPLEEEKKKKNERLALFADGKREETETTDDWGIKFPSETLVKRKKKLKSSVATILSNNGLYMFGMEL